MSSPVQLASFPPEILGEIFLASIPVKGNRDNLPAYFPFTLTHVCRHWHASALAFQKLWSFIDVEQTEENHEGDTGEHELLEEYLARSGDYPLTIYLAHRREDTMLYPTFIATLSEHRHRWETVVFDHLYEYAFDLLVDVGPEAYPKLRSLDCLHSRFVPPERTLGSMPWSQLARYHEYQCSWDPDSFQWPVLQELVNLVDLRVELSFPPTLFKVEMPRLRLAYIHPDHDGADIKQVLNSFEFPSIQGLSLKFLPGHSLDGFLPAQFKHLKVLRLCGRLLISNASFLRILTELEALTDLAVEMRAASSWYPSFVQLGIDAPYLFGLLTPYHAAHPAVLPRLEVLRLTEFNPDGVDALLSMLRQRFAGSTRLQVTRLRRFDLWMRPLSWFVGGEETRHSAIQGGLEALQALKIQEGWDIQVDEEWKGDFWKEEMDL
ncbi:hypothetical protein C8R46DRAFT_1084314 [Mycena filopes]|nr:hypothetical protein C8R46DRAFT_1084314 [Mycena filopes]